MPIYKVTACYYYDVEVEADSEVEAIRKAPIPNSVALCDPEDYLVEQLQCEEDD